MLGSCHHGILGQDHQRIHAGEGRREREKERGRGGGAEKRGTKGRGTKVGGERDSKRWDSYDNRRLMFVCSVLPLPPFLPPSLPPSVVLGLDGAEAVPRLHQRVHGKGHIAQALQAPARTNTINCSVRVGVWACDDVGNKISIKIKNIKNHENHGQELAYHTLPQPRYNVHVYLLN